MYVGTCIQVRCTSLYFKLHFLFVMLLCEVNLSVNFNATSLEFFAEHDVGVKFHTLDKT